MSVESLGSPGPVPPEQRLESLDAIRGVALLGVAVVNLVTIFRVSLFLFLDVFHTEPGLLNHAVDWLIAMLLESKAFALFSLLFGVGLAIFLERAGARERSPRRRLARRLAVLLVIGLLHLVLVWNGDILAAYAVAGLLVMPLIGRWPRLSLGLALAVGALHCLPLPIADVLPHGDAARRYGAEAARAYGGGSWVEILAFRWAETRHLIGPLLLLTLPRVAALFLLGNWAWQRGVLRAPGEHLRLLRLTCALGLLVGGAATATAAAAATTGHSLGPLDPLVSSLSNVPLALGYGAGLLLAWRAAPAAAFALVGRTALSAYLLQSVVFGLIFYGYGAGQFGRLGSAAGALLALVTYAAQVLASAAWLRRFRFGPVEWLWRCLTYGRMETMNRAPEG